MSGPAWSTFQTVCEMHRKAVSLFTSTNQKCLLKERTVAYSLAFPLGLLKDLDTKSLTFYV